MTNYRIPMLTVLLLLATASAQAQTKVWTNADLGRPVAQWPARQATAAELAGLQARTFIAPRPRSSPRARSSSSSASPHPCRRRSWRPPSRSRTASTTTCPCRLTCPSGPGRPGAARRSTRPGRRHARARATAGAVNEPSHHPGAGRLATGRSGQSGPRPGGAASPPGRGAGADPRGDDDCPRGRRAPTAGAAGGRPIGPRRRCRRRPARADQLQSIARGGQAHAGVSPRARRGCRGVHQGPRAPGGISRVGRLRRRAGLYARMRGASAVPGRAVSGCGQRAGTVRRARHRRDRARWGPDDVRPRAPRGLLPDDGAGRAGGGVARAEVRGGRAGRHVRAARCRPGARDAGRGALPPSSCGGRRGAVPTTPRV
jgi:hypothetical protein